MATRKKKNNIGAFGHPIYGKGFAKYGEMRSNGSSEIPNDLEDAAEEHSFNYDSTIYYVLESSNQKTIWKMEIEQAFKAGANWQKEQCKLKVSDDIEGEIESYIPHLDIPYAELTDEIYHLCVLIARHFAEWQKAQDDKLVDTIYQQGIEKGKDDMKDQMMKEAVEGFIFQAEDYYPKELIARYDGELKHGDKVRVIVCKKED